MIIKPFHFQKLFLNVQENILQIISNKSWIGLPTYKERMILKRVQEQLEFMVDRSWKYAPDLFTNIYLNGKIDKYIKSLGMTATDQTAVNRIVDNFMGHILETSSFSYKALKQLMAETRKEVMTLSGSQSTMEQAYKELYVENIKKQGLVGFIDKAGKRWSLGNYTKMLLDTSTRITNNYATVFTYEKHDLYKIIGHGNSCDKCAVHKNRVYSRSGTSQFYPPLASAFGKINKTGPNTLENSYLSIHPNCLVDTGAELITERSCSLSRRIYIGKVMVITDSAGNQLTVTVNHPILTKRGFIPACQLKKGDKVGKATLMYKRLRRQSPYNVDGITSLSKLFETLKVSLVGRTAFMRMPVTTEDFHHDGIPDTEVDIIFMNSFIERKTDPVFSQKVNKILLPSTWFGRFCLDCKSFFYKTFNWLWFTTCGFIASINFIVSRNFKTISTSQTIKHAKTYIKRFCHFWHRHLRTVKFFKFIKQRFIANNPIFRYYMMFKNSTFNRLSFYISRNGVSFVKINNLEVRDFNGYVYNPETYYGFYSYNGFISSNCKCSIIPFTEGGKTAKEIDKIREFSNYESNPPDKDPRTERQIEAYNNKEKGRQRLVNDFKEFQNLKLSLGERMPKTFNTFMKHKQANSNEYQSWKGSIK